MRLFGWVSQLFGFFKRPSPQKPVLGPLAVCRSKEDWDRFTESKEYNSINSLDDSILASGQEINGVRHEDVERLSFSDNHFDLIISADVFEHIPSPQKGLSECARVLKTGGHMLLTIPFYLNREQSICRARIENGDLVFLLPEEYHGNPMSEKGSLVFTDFGWDFLTCAKENGFSESCMEIYHSVEFGHLWPQMIFRFIK